MHTIRFLSRKNYDAAALLFIDPASDTMIRVFMVNKHLTEETAVKPQNLHSPERKGFTVVEWGGSFLEDGKKAVVIE